MNKIKLALYMTSLATIFLYILPDKDNVLVIFQYLLIIVSFILFSIIIIKNNDGKFGNGLVSLILYFDMILFAVALIAVYLKTNNMINKYQEYYLAYAIEVIIISFFGYIAPKLPFNRYIGLRLPWIVVDESTWIYAHKICRKETIPLLCVGTILFISAHLIFKNLDYMYDVAVGLILVYILIPSLLSLHYFRKMYGSSK